MAEATRRDEADWAEWGRLHEEIGALRGRLEKLESKGAEDDAGPPESGPRRTEGDAKKPKEPLRDRVATFVREKRKPILVGVGIAIVLAIATALFVHWLSSFEDTDDAEVDGDVSSVSPRVGGTIARVLVEDNQVVHAGDLLAELDPVDYRIAAARAKASLAQAKALAAAEDPNVPITEIENRTNIGVSEKDVGTAAADVEAAALEVRAAAARERLAEAQDDNARVEAERNRRLFEADAIAKSVLDDRETAAEAAKATHDAARAATASARKKLAAASEKRDQSVERAEEVAANAPRHLDVRRASLASREASVDAAQAELDQAEVNLAFTRIEAPVDGIVGRKGIAVGDRVQPGQAILALVPLRGAWVTANFRETQLRRMRPGLRARVHVDALGRDFKAHVEALPGATGARFSLLPPENATGNFVKVVQRLPVRIVFEPDQQGLDDVRVGMSVEPKVYLP